MSFIVQIIDAALPSDATQRQALIDKLVEESDANDTEPGQALGQLYQQLVVKYPCLSTLKEDAIDECVWGDGPLLGNFGQRIAAVNIYQNEEQVFAYILKLAEELNLKVVDTQSDMVYYPKSAEASEFIKTHEAPLASKKTLTKVNIQNRLAKVLMPLLTPLGFVRSKSEPSFNRKVAYGAQSLRIVAGKRRWGGFTVYFSFRLMIDAVISVERKITGFDRDAFIAFHDDFFRGGGRELIIENETELEALVAELFSLSKDKIVPFLLNLNNLESIYAVFDHADKYKSFPLNFWESLFTLTYLVHPEQIQEVAEIYSINEASRLKINNIVNKLIELNPTL